MILRDGVPIDEGEAEAQEERPVVTVEVLWSEPREIESEPRSITRSDDMPVPVGLVFSVPVQGLRRAMSDALLHEHAVAFLGREGLAVRGEPDLTTVVTEEGRVRRAEYAVTGWQR